MDSDVAAASTSQPPARLSTRQHAVPGYSTRISNVLLGGSEADITASDHHPLAAQFLAYNAGLNGLSMPIYRDLPWSASAEELGTFDLIIGSDILYERAHSATLACLLSRLARPRSEIVITDPGRGNGGRMASALTALGYRTREKRVVFGADAHEPHRGRLLRFSRHHLA